MSHRIVWVAALLIVGAAGLGMRAGDVQPTQGATSPPAAKTGSNAPDAAADVPVPNLRRYPATDRFFAAPVTAAQAGGARNRSVLVVDDDGMGTAADCDDATACYSTIGAAVAAASNGDTIKVCPGTYNEGVVVNKSLTITGDPGDANPGPGAGAPVLDGTSLTGAGFTLATGVSNVIIEGFEIRNFLDTNTGAGDGIESWNNGTSFITIRDNYIHDVGWNGVLVGNSGTGMHTNWTVSANTIVPCWIGVELTNCRDSVIADNVISGGGCMDSSYPPDGWVMGVMLQARSLASEGGNQNITATNIVVRGNTMAALGPATLEYGVYLFAAGDSYTATLLNNQIGGPGNRLENNNYYGVVARGYNLGGYYGSLGSVNGLSITGNELDNNAGAAVRVLEATQNVSVFDNSVAGSATWAVRNTTASTVDASGNWWGTNAAGAVAAQMSGAVDYTPWLDTGTDSDAGVGFAGDFSTLHVDDASPQTGTIGRVQEGVDLATGSTVYLLPGTYEEQVVIDDNDFHLIGSGAGNNPAVDSIIQSPTSLAWFFTTSANNYPVIGVHDATGVSIENLRVDGLGRGNANYRFEGVAFWNAGGTVDGCYITNVQDTPFSGAQHGVAVYAYNNTGGPYALTVADTTVTEFQKTGMALNGTGLTATVTGCTAQGKGFTPITAQNGIQFGWGAGGSLTDCEVTDVGYTGAYWSATALLFYQGSTVSVSGGYVLDAQSGAVFQETQGSVSGLYLVGGDIDWASGVEVRDYGYASGPGQPAPLPAVSPFAEDQPGGDGPRGTATSVTVDDCVLVGSGLPNSYGVAAWSVYAGGDNADVTVTDSQITNWEFGAVAYEESIDKAHLSISNSALADNDWGFSTNATAVQDAQSNWWGAASGPNDTGETIELGACTATPKNEMNADGAGNAVDDTSVYAVDYCPWLTSYPRIALEPSASCIADPNQIIIRIWVHDLTQVIQGGQFFMAYDNTVLDFLSADPGDAPFTLQVYESVNEAAGTIDYATGVPLGFPNGTLYPNRIMARLKFKLMPAYTELCDVGSLIWFRPHFPPTRLTTTTAPVVVPTFALGDITVDAEAPSWATTPANVIVDCGGLTDPPATGVPTATDNCDASPTITYADNRSGLTGCNATGNILRTWTVTDCAGNTATHVQTITLVDTVAPALTCPANITTPNDPNVCSAVVTYTCPVAEDTCYFQGFENAQFQAGDWTLVPSVDWNEYNSQVYRVLSGTDGIPSKTGGAHAYVDSTVLPPSPDDYSGAFSRLRGYSGVWGDGFRTAVDVYINLADPAVAAKTYGFDISTAANTPALGHRRDFIFHAAADDNTAPGCVLIAASNNSNFAKRNDLETINHYTVCTTGWYTFEWVFRDFGDGTLAVDCNLRDASGTWLWTETRHDASDVLGVTVGGNRYMWFTFVAADKLAIDNTRLTRFVDAVCTPASGSAFNVGTTTVNVSAADACANTATCSFTVTVNDTQPPLALCPGNIVQGNDPNQCGAVVTWVANVWDNCPGATIACVPASGSFFTVGTHTVTCTATDAALNTAQCSFTVTVNDTQAPFVTCPANITVNAAAGSCSASVAFAATATDNCDPSPTITYWLGGYGGTQIFSPHTFAAGAHVVTAHAVDDSANASTCTFTVTVNVYNDLSVTVTIQGPIMQATTRGITFTFRDCPGGTPVTICRDLTFPISGGDSTATATFTDLPCSATPYDCAMAEDALHSLQATVAPTIVAGQYVASFTGGDKLMQGDLYNDNLIDIVDFGVFIYSWGWIGGPHTPCGFVGPHADMDASGYIDSTDYAFITSNFLLIGEDGCCGLLAMDQTPRTAITMSEAAALGLPYWLDQNADGVFDLTDVQIFINGGPDPTPAEETNVNEENAEAVVL